ncbi:MAG TPA: hypothetical protein VGO59_00605 [Verrucomicrobiae bacterium]|jgi:hypothetical protein
MGILLVLIFLALSSWAVVALFRRLQRQHVRVGWWVAFGILAACGATLGTTSERLMSDLSASSVSASSRSAMDVAWHRLAKSLL